MDTFTHNLNDIVDIIIIDTIKFQRIIKKRIIGDDDIRINLTRGKILRNSGKNNS